MSIINDFRNETRGGNRPYQSSVLKGLQQIKDNGDEANLLLATLQSVLSEGKDFEAKLVIDSLGVTFLEVRSFDVDSGTLGTPLYYFPGSTTPETPTAPIKYINPETFLAQIVSNTTSIVITPSIIRATGAGTIAAGAYSFSVANVGSLSGVLLGVTIKPGEVINFDAGSLNNTYGAVSYDGTGTELLITVNS
jgi:hypothetical protein